MLRDFSLTGSLKAELRTVECKGAGSYAPGTRISFDASWTSVCASHEVGHTSAQVYVGLPVQNRFSWLDHGKEFSSS